VAKITPCFENGKGACLDGLSTPIGFGSTEFIVVRATEAVLPRYLYRITTLPEFRIRGADAMTGSAGQQRVPTSFVENYVVSIPPLQEQGAIVRFLDHSDQKIRRFIQAKRRLIELLNEQKRSVIGGIVTRGADPYSPRKNSGISWAPEIPSSWEVSKVKNEFECLNSRRIPLSGVERGKMTSRTFDYYGASGVIDKVDDYIFDEDLLLIAEDGANLVSRNLPLAITARGRYWVNNHAHILKPLRGDLDYLALLMEVVDYLPWISGAAQPKLTRDRLMAVSLPIPPPEQQPILKAIIGQETKTLGKAIDRSKQEISLIREYRTRLIADVVTGKLDVREAAERLPLLTEQESLDDGSLDLVALDPEEAGGLDDDPQLLPVADEE